MQAALPGLYDWIQVQYRAWPSLAVCWSASGSSPAVLIFSEQTDGRCASAAQPRLATFTALYFSILASLTRCLLLKRA